VADRLAVIAIWVCESVKEKFMLPNDPREHALNGSNAILRWAMWFTLASLPLGVVSGLLFTLVMAVGLILAIVGIVWRLFGVVQIRIGELLLLIAVLGNIYGLTFGALFGTERTFHGETVPAFCFVIMASLVWILGSVTTGLLIAARLGQDATADRLKYVGFFLIYPLGIASVFVCAIMSLIFIAEQSSLFALTLVIGIFGGWIWHFGRQLQFEARLAERARDANARASHSNLVGRDVCS
jgi:hypothetical protein